LKSHRKSNFDYLPGQFLTLIMPIEGEEVSRSYSLCTSPYLDEDPAITVKRVESGVVSNYLNDHMKAGDVFDVMDACGSFYAST
jgi:ring-1,2-phenylacetyl-CoA epoxidase subunit PaaE